MRTLLLASLFVALSATHADEVYAGSYEGGTGEGEITITIKGDPKAEKRPAAFVCTWDGGDYTYEGSFGPVAEDGTIKGTATVDDELWNITGTIKDGVFKAVYIKEDESDEGEMTLKPKAAE